MYIAVHLLPPSLAPPLLLTQGFTAPPSRCSPSPTCSSCWGYGRVSGKRRPRSRQMQQRQMQALGQGQQRIAGLTEGEHQEGWGAGKQSQVPRC